MPDAYDDDIVLWSAQQAALLRRLGPGEHVNAQVDFENIAEEIVSLGRSDRREIGSCVATILFHLIKLQVSPATAPRDGRRDTILVQREGLRRLIKESPSLRPTLATVIAEELDAARARAELSLAGHYEDPLVDLDPLTYSEDQVLGPWMPQHS